MKTIVAFSGGKDSTAMAMKLADQGDDFELMFTPTGNELPELLAHIVAVVKLINRPLITPANQSLDYWMDFFNALPNWRQRWCTRLIKIEPCIAYLTANPGSVLCVGLRADEEQREGLWGPYATYRYPLRELGWGIGDVRDYLKSKGVSVPSRTDCAFCYGQRIAEWFRLWRDHPRVWAQGEEREEKTGHTFRSAARDTWPASMKELRGQFESGRRPRGMPLNVLTEEDGTEGQPEVCRVCRF